MAIFEYSGVATANSLDVISPAQGNRTALNSGNVATTANGDLLLGAATTADANMLTAGPGYTLEELIPTSPGTRLTVEDHIQTTAGSTSAGITLDAAKDWAMGLAAFKKAPNGEVASCARCGSESFSSQPGWVTPHTQTQVRYAVSGSIDCNFAMVTGNSTCSYIPSMNSLTT